MYSVLMFVLAVAGFALGLSLVSYRWLAAQNAWPMGVWQAERPMLPRLIGVGAMVVALVAAAMLGGTAVLLVVLLGLIGAFIWMILLKVAAQSALLLAPGIVVLVLAGWLFAA